jgi:hypothetical protein
MAALRSAGPNLLRLTGFDSIREGLEAVMHDITHGWRWLDASQKSTHSKTLNQPQHRPMSKASGPLRIRGGLHDGWQLGDLLGRKSADLSLAHSDQLGAGLDGNPARFFGCSLNSSYGATHHRIAALTDVLHAPPLD